MAADLISARRTAQRRTAREAQARAEAQHAARVALWVARLTRRAPGALDAHEVTYAAERMVATRYEHDHLAHRAPPEPYRGWRTDTQRHVAYLFGLGAGSGLPLAAEGGAPLRCADPVTANLSQANYAARRATPTP